jgi:thioredoxin 1
MFEEIEEANAADWKERILEAKKLVVVQFWSPYCPHCRAIKPVYDELAIEYGEKLKFTKLNVMDSPENQQLAAKHGIMGTPTFLFSVEADLLTVLLGHFRKKTWHRQEFTIEKYQHCSKKSTPLKLSYIS